MSEADEAVGRVQKAVATGFDSDTLAGRFAATQLRFADLRAVLARVAECEADKRRLDWLEAKKPGFALVADIGGPWQIEITVGERDECESWEAPTYRAAIDHAMRGGV